MLASWIWTKYGWAWLTALFWAGHHVGFIAIQAEPWFFPF